MNPFKNIIFVTLDGYRKDKLDLCPNLKTHVEDSIYFENMITVAPYTLAAHHSIFSGMYPLELIKQGTSTQQLEGKLSI